MVGRSLSVRFDTLSLPLDETKAAAKAAGGRLNDAFLAGIVGGLRAYHDHHGASIDRLRMSMPINIRTDATQDLAGNAFAPARFVVPVGVADPLARMAMIRDLVAQQRAEPALVLLEPLALLLFRLPASVSTAVFQSLLKGIDFVASNVPGVPVPVYLAGAEILSQFPFGPLSGAATNITLLSYRDQLHLGINTDPAAVPDGDVFTSCLRDGFDEILKVG
jgi:diacylglycerol O-acyltransferase